MYNKVDYSQVEFNRGLVRLTALGTIAVAVAVVVSRASDLRPVVR